MKEIITNPFYAIIAVVVIWQILNLILVRESNLSKKAWSRLEYIWIVIGFMGVISLIIQNDRNYKTIDLKRAENWIENQFESLLSFAEKETVCFQYTRSEWLQAEEFDRRQAESDRLCKWVKEEIVQVLKQSKNTGYSKIGDYKKIELNHLEGTYTPERIINDIDRINVDIANRDILRDEIRVNYWYGFQYSIGVILLIFAFALRLTLVTKKVMTE